MKIKVDFITNSSSSSFVVAWPFKIKTLDDVLKFISNEAKAEVVFSDSKKQKGYVITETKNVIKLLADKLDGGHLTGYHDYGHWEENFLKRNNITYDQIHTNKQWLHLLWDEQEKLREITSIKNAFEFIETNTGLFLYVYDYGDDDGEFYSEMEHGGTFNNLQHIQVSHH